VLNSDMLSGVKENFTERILTVFFFYHVVRILLTMDNRNKDTKEEKKENVSNSKGISLESVN
jgi:hypothetical protein